MAADSPASISGQTFDTVITSGSGVYQSSGSYRWILGEDGKYVAFGLTPNLTDRVSGGFSYQRVTTTAGQMSFNDAIRAGYVQTFTYSTTNSGTFTLGNVGFPGGQRGTFRSYHGTAPVHAEKKVFVIQNATGNMPFAGRSAFRMITRSNDYTVQDITGKVNLFTGKHSYTKQAKTSGILQFTDPTHTNKLAIFTFENANSGSVFMRHTNRTTLVGTFTMASLQAPRVVTPPVSVTVPVGGKAVFSVGVAGTQPISYQWYQGTTLLAGEIRTNLQINPVTREHQGSYTLRAVNFAGTAEVSVTLTAFCQYKVSTNRVFADYKGGEYAIQVLPGGTCPWRITNAAPWITFGFGATNMTETNLTFTVAPNTNATARIGHFQVKGVEGNPITVAVVQGTAFTPESVAGRTMLLQSTNGVGVYGGTGTNLVVFSSGAPTAAIVAPKAETNTVEVDYSFTRTGDDSASITFGFTEPAQLQLTYTSATAGTFTGINAAGNDVTGTFRWVLSSPDFNGDFRGDLVWQAGNRTVAAWYMMGNQFVKAEALANGGAPPVGYRAFGAADFNLDGNTDVILQESAARLKVWLMDGKTKMSTLTLRDGSAPQGWKAFSTGDFNNDGRADVAFQHTNGALRVWLFNGTNFLGVMPLRDGQSAGPAWKAVTAGDFNGDGQTDVAVQHTTGKIAIWYLNNGSAAATETVRGGVIPAGWRLVGAGDINEDAQLDLILLTPANQVAVWPRKNGTLGGTTVYLRNKQPVTAGWTLVAPK